MKPTAVEWFFSELERMQYFIGNDMLEAYNRAKEMEKEHLCKMYIQGRNDNHLDYYPEKHAKETYDEMFKSE